MLSVRLCFLVSVPEMALEAGVLVVGVRFGVSCEYGRNGEDSFFILELFRKARII
jgi:hypothetical protein